MFALIGFLSDPQYRPQSALIAGYNCTLLNCVKANLVTAVTSAPVSTLNFIFSPFTVMFAVQDVSSVETTALKNARSRSSSPGDVSLADDVTSVTVVVRHCLLKCPFFLHL